MSTPAPRAPSLLPSSLPQTVATIRIQAIVVIGLIALLLGSGMSGAGLILMLLLGLMTVSWPPAVKLGPLPALRVLAVYLPFAVLWYAFTFGYLYLMHAAGTPVLPQPQLAELADEGATLPGLVQRLIGIVLLAPLYEEIVFRGYLFSAVRTWLPALATNVVTSALFGLVHGLDYALPIGVLALLFGWLRTRYDSLLPSIFAHAVHNGVTVTIALGWPQLLELMYPQ